MSMITVQFHTNLWMLENARNNWSVQVKVLRQNIEGKNCQSNNIELVRYLQTHKYLLFVTSKLLLYIHVVIRNEKQQSTFRWSLAKHMRLIYNVLSAIYMEVLVGWIYDKICLFCMQLYDFNKLLIICKQLQLKIIILDIPMHIHDQKGQNSTFKSYSSQ